MTYPIVFIFNGDQITGVEFDVTQDRLNGIELLFDALAIRYPMVADFQAAEMVASDLNQIVDAAYRFDEYLFTCMSK